MSRQRNLIRALGGRVKGRGNAVRYEGVRVTREPVDSLYRVPSQRPEPDPETPALSHDEVEQGLRELSRKGLVSDGRELDITYLVLTGQQGNVCRVCGYMTRQPDAHKQCEQTTAKGRARRVRL